MHESFSFNSLVIITLLAFIVPILIEKIKKPKIPVVVGEIIAGVIVGKSGLNLIESGLWLEFLSEFGFAFLMFLSGLEIDFDLIKKASLKNKKTKGSFGGPILISGLIFLLTLIISFIISNIFVAMNMLASPWLMTLIISTTSLAIVMPTLKEKGIINTDYGQQLLISSLLADFLTILMITIFVMLLMSGTPYKILLISILFLAFILFHKMGIVFQGSTLFDELAHATSQIKVRASFALILIFIALAEQLGIEIILGAFLAGAIVSLVSNDDKDHLNHKLDAIGYGFFIPIFFIMVGVDFNIKVLFNSPDIWLFTVLLILASYFVKLIPALLFKRDYSWAETLSAGFLLSSRLSLIIAASAIGLELEMISESINSAIILTAIFTCTVSPILFDYFYPEHEQKKERIVIAGGGELTFLLMQKVKSDDRLVTLITTHENKIERFKNLTNEVIKGDPRELSVLESAKLAEASTFLVATDCDDVNEEICKVAIENFVTKNIIALNTNIANKKKLLDWGVKVVTPSLATVILLNNLIRNPRTFAILTEEKLTTEELKLTNQFYIGKKVSELDLLGDSLLLSIERNDELIIPHGYNKLQYGDVLTIVGSDKCVREVVGILKRAS
jgi:Kef-type K+ transport system membrane component KefB/Trk K+ transport system NAD-binding subunit